MVVVEDDSANSVKGGEIISQGIDGKLGGLRTKHADSTRTFCELSASTC